MKCVEHTRDTKAQHMIVLHQRRCLTHNPKLQSQRGSHLKQ